MEKDLKIVFLFSGQGSHYRGMGQQLFENNDCFRKSLEASDQIIRQQLGRSIIQALYTVKHPTFDDLLMTHPGIVAVEIAMYKVLESMDIVPDYVLGNSLGEFAAAVAANIWNPEMALEAAIEQAKTIHRSNLDGGMLAVLHQRDQKLQNLYTQHQLFLASDNFNGHFTLAGETKNLAAFEQELKEKKIQFLRLPVTCPFHSPLLKKAQQNFNYYSNTTAHFNTPQLPFVSGIQAKELHEIPCDYFWNAVAQYNNFIDCINYFENTSACLYIDLGPSGTSAAFAKYNLKPNSFSQTFQIMTPFKTALQQLKKLKNIFQKNHY